MKPIDANSAAFPCEQGTDPNGSWNQTFEPGLSKREYFAAMALQGILAGTSGDTFDPITIAYDAIKATDVLLEILEQTNA